MLSLAADGPERAWLQAREETNSRANIDHRFMMTSASQNVSSQMRLVYNASELRFVRIGGFPSLFVPNEPDAK